MAKQVLLEELQGCKTYLGWIVSKLDCEESRIENSASDRLYCEESDLPKVSRELCRFLFETDFTWDESVKDDEIRATDALEIRKIYARDVGENAGKSDRDIDRIRKSIHGKTSVLELIYSLCMHLDGMVNEDEPGSMIGFFYRILVNNLKLDEFSDSDFKVGIVDTGQTLREAKENAGKDLEAASEEHEKAVERSMKAAARRGSAIREIWGARVKKWLARDYFESGCNGGMFPLYEWKETDKDQRKVSLWYQMNSWLNEHLDDEERFVIEKVQNGPGKRCNSFDF